MKRFTVYSVLPGTNYKTCMGVVWARSESELIGKRSACFPDGPVGNSLVVSAVCHEDV